MIDIIYYQDGLKKGKLSDLKKLKNKKIWVDITDISKEEEETIQKIFKLHPLTAEDLQHSNVRIKVEEFPNYLFCIFYGIKKTKSIELIELDYIIGDNFLITNHRLRLESYEDLKSDKTKLGRLFSKRLEFIFHRLLDTEIANFMPVLENIDDQIECIEEKLAKRPKPELMTQILKLKRQIVTIKKVTLPQREKISFIAKNEYKHISKEVIPYLRDVYDRSIKVSDSIDNYREAVSNTFDAYMSAVSNNMNEVMKTLSIIATIALPLTVISGIYGTNFNFLPGQHNPYGFWAMIFVMVLVVSGMVLMFKRRKWF